MRPVVSDIANPGMARRIEDTMLVVVTRSSEYTKAQSILLGVNVPTEVQVEVDPVTLPEPIRADIVGINGSYPDVLGSVYAASYRDTLTLDGNTGYDHKICIDAETADITPATIGNAIAAAIALARAELSTRVVEKDKKRTEREARVAAAVGAFFADPKMGFKRIGSSIIIAGEWLYDSDADHAQVINEADRREALRQADDAREHAEAKALRQAEDEALKQQITTWVTTRGTDSQRGRLSDGLLPDDEIIEAIRIEALAPLSGEPRYVKIEIDDLRVLCDRDHDDDDDTDDPEYTSTDAESATDEQYSVLVRIRQKIQEVHPDAVVTLKKHEGKWNCGYSGCPWHKLERYGVHVLVTIGSIRATAEFAV